jgi:hypothetical protein
MVFTGDVWPLPVGFVTFRQLCGIFQRGVIVSSEFLVGLWCLTVVFVISGSSVVFSGDVWPLTVVSGGFFFVLFFSDFPALFVAWVVVGWPIGGCSWCRQRYLVVASKV